MTALVTTKGPNPGQRFELAGDSASIGREPEATIYLESLAVSRKHARILRRNDSFFVEDAGSSNGTWLNGARVTQRMPLTERDELQIGPYVLALRTDAVGPVEDLEPIVKASISAASSNYNLYAQNSTYKLQIVLEIAQHLSRTLSVEALLNRLLEQLLRLFPQADRGMVMLCERERFLVRAQRCRRGPPQTDYPYSRTIVRRALDEGVALLSEDVPADPNLAATATVVSLKLRSFLCVPLLSRDGDRLGVIQLDSLRESQTFHSDDLEALTAIGLHVAVVLENASLHEVQLREARMSQELMMAREVQQSFLPREFKPLGEAGPELFAEVLPARDVSGDLYDFFPLPGGRLAFFLGDVSGKGMPAALFMIAVRTLSRHLAPSTLSPGDLLKRLHAALTADNPTNKFVTLLHGVYNPADGSVVLVSGGHPPPLLRRADGAVQPIELTPGPMIGFSLLPVCKRVEDLDAQEVRFTLQPGETLILYTDGFTEAFTADRGEMFGLDRLRQAVGGERTKLSLEECARAAAAAVQRFTGGGELQDDQTLLLLRRRV